MYRDLYEKFNETIAAEDFEAENAPITKAPEEGLINPRRKEEPPKADEYDPLSLMKEWMQVIKASGAEHRKKSIAQHEGALTQTVEPQTPVKKEPKPEPEEPQETPKEAAKRKVASIFDGDSLDEGSFVLPTYSGPKGEMVSLARQAAQEQGVPEDLFLTLVGAESNFNPKARSGAGAIGLAQLMPDTARGLGVNPHDPVENLAGGARYLKQQYEKFGSWPLALAAYNAGPGAVEKYGGIPPFKETQNYVRKILK